MFSVARDCCKHYRHRTRGHPQVYRKKDLVQAKVTLRQYNSNNKSQKGRLPRPDVRPLGFDVEGHGEHQKMRNKFLGIMSETKQNRRTKEYLDSYFPDWAQQQVKFEMNQPVDLLSEKTPTEMLTIPGLDPLDLDDDYDMAKALTWLIEHHKAQVETQGKPKDGITDYYTQDRYSAKVQIAEREAHHLRFARVWEHAQAMSQDPSVGPMYWPWEYANIEQLAKEKDMKGENPVENDMLNELSQRPKHWLKEEKKESIKKGLNKNYLVDILTFYELLPKLNEKNKDTMWRRMKKDPDTYEFDEDMAAGEESMARRMEQSEEGLKEGEELDLDAIDKMDNMDHMDKSKEDDDDYGPGGYEDDRLDEDDGDDQDKPKAKDAESEFKDEGINEEVDDEDEPEESFDQVGVDMQIEETEDINPKESLPYDFLEADDEDDEEFEELTDNAVDEARQNYMKENKILLPGEPDITTEDIHNKYEALLTQKLLFYQPDIENEAGTTNSGVRELLRQQKILSQKRDEEIKQLLEIKKNIADNEEAMDDFGEKYWSEHVDDEDDPEEESEAEAAAKRKADEEEAAEQEHVQYLKTHEHQEVGELTIDEVKKMEIHDAMSDQSEDETLRYEVLEILKIGRHTQITAAGRVYSFSTLILMGTGNGAACLGYGRAENVMEATNLAKLDGENHMLTVKLHRNSIGADIYKHYKKSRVFLLGKPPGSGMTCSFQMGLVMRAFGIEDVTVGVGGSRNPSTRYRALFLALRDGVRSPDDVARLLGRKLFDRDRAYYYKGE